MKQIIWFTFFLGLYLITTPFISNAKDEPLPIYEKKISDKEGVLNKDLIRVPFRLLKLTNVNVSQEDGESAVIAPEKNVSQSDEDVNIFDQPLWVSGELNPVYIKWYSSKLHNLIQYINLYTFRNIFLIMPTTTTDTLAEGTDRIRVGGNLSSVFSRQTQGRFDAQFDYEVIEGYVLLNYGLMKNLEGGIYTRFFHYSAGRLDGPKNKFEKAVRGSSGNRGQFLDNQYAHILKIDGKEIQSGKKNEVGLGDVIATLKYKVLDEKTNIPAITIMGALKMPIGDQDQGFGSGTWDIGSSLILSKHLTNRLRTHLNLGAAKPLGNGNFPNTATVFSIISAIEYAFNKTWQVALQANYSTSPFRRTGIDAISKNSFNMGGVVTYNFDSGIILNLSFIDEIFHTGDPDYKFGWSIDIWPLITSGEDQDEANEEALEE
ncbi:MAG: transporter [Deltaproteobacteria bacterium]|nr:transporter [Deltaproteobacteria bacterium]